MGEKLQTVADAQDGYTERENGWVRGRRVVVVDRAGSSGENEPDRMMGLDLGNRGATGKNDREDVLFSDAAGDELSVLAAEIKNDDRGGIHCLVWQEAGENAMDGASARLFVAVRGEFPVASKPVVVAGFRKDRSLIGPSPGHFRPT